MDRHTSEPRCPHPRVIGGLILAVLSMALTYGMIFGPMWKINVLIVAAIALTWIFGRQKRELVRA